MEFFVSYAHSDYNIIQPLIESLQEEGHLLIRNEQTSPPDKKSWYDSIREAIQNADVFLHALSPDSLNSQRCQWELALAIELGKPIIRLLITNIPDLPNHSDIIDFRQGFSNKKKTLKTLFEFIQIKNPYLLTEDIPSYRTRSVRILPLLIILMILLVGTAGILFFQNQESSQPENNGITAPKLPIPTIELAENEMLILIAESADEAIAQPWQTQIQEQITNHPIKILELPQRISSQQEAISLAKSYQAFLVVWGTEEAQILTNVTQNTFNADEVLRPDLFAYPFQIRIPLSIHNQEYLEIFLQAHFAYVEDRLRATSIINQAITSLTGVEGWGNILQILHFYRGYIYQALEGNPQQAINSYNRALATNPIFSVVYNNRGKAYVTLEDYEQALTNFNRGLELNPQPQFHVNKGDVLYLQADYANAIAEYNLALSLDEQYVLAYLSRANAYRQTNQLQAALDDYNTALNYDTNVAGIYIGRGTTYHRLNNFEQAVEDYNRAIALEPQVIATYINRGNAYRQLGNFEAAIESYNIAIELDSTVSGSFLGRGNLYYTIGNYEQAIEDYNRAIILEPSSKIFVNRGNAYRELGDLQATITNYDLAILYDDSDSELYLQRGNLHFRQESYQLAVEDYRRVIELNPQSIIAYINLGNTYRRLAEYEQAIEVFDQAIELDSENPTIYQYRGQVYFALQQYDNTIADYETYQALTGDLLPFMQNHIDQINNPITENSSGN